MVAEVARGVREDSDKTLYWTLSLYVDAHNLPLDFAEVFAPAHQVDVQKRMFETQRLRWAIEPMFNDIADRERLGVVEDYLLDVRGDHQGRVVQFQIPPTVEWTTEGKTFAAEIGAQPPRPLRCRSFWYVHANGALSYHLSFSLNYQHTPADFYFMSLLQKVAAPKEFRPADLPASGKGARPIRVTDAETGVFPLDNIRVQAEGDKQAVPFWHFVAARFEADAADLFSNVPLKKPRADGARLQAGSYFSQLVALDDFIETPGLKMPRSRFMFMFDDRTFVRDLLPRDASGGARARSDVVQVADYIGYPGAIKQMARQAQGRVVLGADFLNRVAPEHLRYLFLAGFNQNIIDFLNQEAHEVLDSLDPIYPTSEEQEAESFFVRYANPRCLTTFASQLRSLDLGNDYIGTCPYAFLIHVLAMHNEFIVRNYERQADKLVREVAPADRRTAFAKAAKAFHDFHKNEYASYYRYRARNIFRYDTEQDVFKALEDRRGIEKRAAEVERSVANAEKFTHDLEARKRQEDATLFAWLAGVFALCQIGFQLIEKTFDTRFPDDGNWGAWVASSSFWNLLMLILAAAGGVWAFFVFLRWIRRV